MKTILTDANLSQVYTNHSISATVVTTLDSETFEARHIQAVGGHKYRATIRTSAKYCPPSKKREMFQALIIDNPRQNLQVAQRAKKSKTTPTSTVSKPPHTNNDTDFLDFVPIDNNVQDFELSNIIANIEKTEMQTITNKTKV